MVSNTWTSLVASPLMPSKVRMVARVASVVQVVVFPVKSLCSIAEAPDSRMGNGSRRSMQTRSAPRLITAARRP